MGSLVTSGFAIAKGLSVVIALGQSRIPRDLTITPTSLSSSDVLLHIRHVLLIQRLRLRQRDLKIAVM